MRFLEISTLTELDLKQLLNIFMDYLANKNLNSNYTNKHILFWF